MTTSETTTTQVCSSCEGTGRLGYTSYRGRLTPIRCPRVCAICEQHITGSRVRHNGQNVHAACWKATGEAPDIIRGLFPEVVATRGRELTQAELDREHYQNAADER